MKNKTVKEKDWIKVIMKMNLDEQLMKKFLEDNPMVLSDDVSDAFDKWMNDNQ